MGNRASVPKNTEINYKVLKSTEIVYTNLQVNRID